MTTPLNAVSDSDSLDAELSAVVAHLGEALQRRLGNAIEISNIDVATLGGSNRTVLFDVRGAGQRRRLVLRQETISMAYSPFLPSATQYAVLSAAYRHGMPVPEPIFELEPVDELGQGYVVAAVAGESLPKRLLSGTQFATARARYLKQAGAMLAKLHGIDVAEFAVLETVPDTLDALGAQIGYYDGYGEPHPALEFAFRWLEKSQPPANARVPLHGDFRNGNMLVGEEGIRALLDWECAHIGDPLEDFGWFCTRSWRFGAVDRPAGGFGSRETLYRAYEEAGGRTIDREAARWWEIFGLMRWALYNIMQIVGHVNGTRRSPAFAACGRNTALIEYEMLMTMAGKFD